MAVQIIGTTIIVVAGTAAIFCIYKFVMAMREVNQVSKSLNEFVTEGRKQLAEERKRYTE